MNSTTARMILRRTAKDAVTGPVLAKRVRKASRVTVVDEKPDSLLLEGEAGDMERILEGVDGWTLINLQKFQVPDTRPKILGPPADE